MPKFYAVGTEPDVGVVLFEFESRHERRTFFMNTSKEGYDRFLVENRPGTGTGSCNWSGAVPHAWEGPISEDARYRDVLPVKSCDMPRLRSRFNLQTIRKGGQIENWIMDRQEEFRANNPLRALAEVGG
jgi:hypothetical protein